MPRTFTSVADHPSVSKKLISLIGPSMLPATLLRSKHPPLEFVGLSTSPEGVQNFSELFLESPV